MGKKHLNVVDVLRDVLSANDCTFEFYDQPINDTQKLTICSIIHKSQLFTKPIQVDVVIMQPGDCGYTDGSVLSPRIQLRISNVGIYSRFFGLPFTEKLKVVNIIDNQLIGLNTRIYESNSNDLFFTSDHFISNKLSKTNMYKQVEHVIVATLQLFDETVITLKRVLESGTELFMVVKSVDYLHELHTPTDTSSKDVCNVLSALVENHIQSIIYFDIAGLQTYIPFQNETYNILKELQLKHDKLRFFVSDPCIQYLEILMQLYNYSLDECKQYNDDCMCAIGEVRQQSKQENDTCISTN